MLQADHVPEAPAHVGAGEPRVGGVSAGEALPAAAVAPDTVEIIDGGKLRDCLAGVLRVELLVILDLLDLLLVSNLLGKDGLHHGALEPAVVGLCGRVERNAQSESRAGDR